MKTAEAIDLFTTSRRSKGLSRQAIRWYAGILAAFALRYPELPEGPEAIEEFIGSCPAGDERRHGYYRTLKAFYRFLHKRYQIPNPVELCDPPRRTPKLPRPLTLKELRDLVAFPHEPKIAAYIQFLADTGARLDELHDLTADSFTETPYGYAVKLIGKTGPRLVPVSDSTYFTIVNYLPIMCSEWWLCRQLSRAFENARIKGTAHTLRHTFCSLWLGPEDVLQKIAGHRHYETTLGYRAIRINRMSELHRQFSPFRMITGQTRPLL